MSQNDPFDPYQGNILISGLGPILSRQEALKVLTHLPTLSRRETELPPHLALHALMKVSHLHLPFEETGKLFDTVGLMVRQGYQRRDPLLPSTWASISGEPPPIRRSLILPIGAAAVGPSGAGKTQAILRCLETYPQVINHESFPRVIGSFQQVVYLSLNVPASGKSSDLAASLMGNWDETTGGNRFAAALRKERRDGPRMLDEWLQVARSHFLGMLHLDEVQNFFKLSSLYKRRKLEGNEDLRELSIVEDQTLKWVLSLMNSQIPLMVSGTPDGIAALMRRLSNAERFVSTGFHSFLPFEGADAPGYKKVFLKQLGQYQFVVKKILVNDALADLIISLTAGISRLIVALWVAAHRVAFERNGGDLLLQDFVQAAATYLAPVGPAVRALLSKDPQRMARYEDLLPRDDLFWSSIYTPR